MPTPLGQFRTASAGYRVYHPAPLSEVDPIDLGGVMHQLIRAERAIGMLEGVTGFGGEPPNQDLLVAMHIRKEAVLSSQIEGTQASLDDVLRYEAGIASSEHDSPPDIDEVFNYVDALNHGLQRMRSVPLSTRLLKEVHKRLLANARGKNRAPGQFRRTQNWIGSGGGIQDAVFVPPPPNEVEPLLDDLVSYMHTEDDLPELIRCGVAHCRFETIHPFLDGNGRVGRMLITLYLHHRGLRNAPLLTLSAYLKEHQGRYYELLMGVREQHDLAAWLRFFLEGIEAVATRAIETIRAIAAHRQEHASLLEAKGRESANAARLLEMLYRRPIVDAKIVREALEVSQPTANSLLGEFETLGILIEITGRKRDRKFRFESYTDLLTG